MSSTQDRIYQYFERDPELKVLFIFNNEFIAAELANVEWRPGYRYVDFKGDWFTVKYRLDNDWRFDKVILLFHQARFFRTFHRLLHLQGVFPN